MILQGTTPTLTISIDADELSLEDVVGVEFTFQSGQKVTKKSMSALTIDTGANTIAYTFSEAETLALYPSSKLIWQIRFKLQDGVIVGTDKQSIDVIDLISGEVM